MSYTILGLDTETTGLLEPILAPVEKQPHIIEFCFLEYKQKKDKLILKRTFEALVCPPIEIPQFITRITKIEPYMVKNEKPFCLYSKKIKKIIERANLFVAQNATFDMRMVINEFTRLNKSIKFPPIYFTIENSMYIRGRRLKNSEIYKEVKGVEGAGLHRAKADITETMEIYAALNGLTIVEA